MEDRATLEDLTGIVRRFCEERDWDPFHGAKDLAIGVVTEAAELLEHFRFRSHEEAEALLRLPEKRREVEDELADVLFFLLRFSQRYGIDLAAALTAKVERNREKYPVEKARGRNAKYTDL